ncbi:hypothetical protein MBLNU230_g2739t1 [Neophaeotheca triangularis]
MSGIEVAGVLLGAFPLIISALEHFETTKKGVRGWWKIRTQYKKDLGRLRTCELKFQLNLKALLGPLEFEGTIAKTDVDRMLRNVDDVGWQNSDVQEALIERLGPTKTRFLDIIQEMNEAIVQLARKSLVNDPSFQTALQAGVKAKDARLKLTANEHIAFECKRIMYTVSGTTREALLGEIDRLNDDLSKFLRACDGLAQFQDTPEKTSSRRMKRKYRHLLGFWKHAESVYFLIQQAWQCKCAPWHCAYLWLDRRTSSPDDCFEILLRFSDGASRQQLCAPATWQEQGLRLQKSLDAQSKYDAPDPQPEEGIMKTVVFSLPTRSHPVVMGVEPATSVSPGGKASASQITTAATPTSQPRAIEIAKVGLCESAERSQKLIGDTSLGLLSDSQTGCCFSVFSTCSSVTASVSLASILEDANSRYGLFRTQRLTLAYTIASSFLQLYETPWLRDQAMARAISLPLTADSKNVCFDKPFVHVAFKQNMCEWVENEALIELGILLLELCFNRPLESHHEWQDRKLTNLSSDRLVRQSIAMKWSKKVVHELDNDYFIAVDWCLHKATLTSADWRLDFAKMVVQPLRLCYEAVPVIQ